MFRRLRHDVGVFGNGTSRKGQARIEKIRRGTGQVILVLLLLLLIALLLRPTFFPPGWQHTHRRSLRGGRCGRGKGVRRLGNNRVGPTKHDG